MEYEILIDQDRLRNRIKELGKILKSEYQDKNPLLIGVLKGAYIFLSDLSRSLDFPHTVDFMAVASYGSSTTSSGVVRILKDLDAPLYQRHVIVVEDIIDSGLTLSYLKRLLNSRMPASLKVCTLLDKKIDEKKSDELADYIGFEIPNKFVIGYGLDYNQQYRNLPYIAYFKDVSSV